MSTSLGSLTTLHLLHFDEALPFLCRPATAVAGNDEEVIRLAIIITTLHIDFIVVVVVVIVIVR